MYQLTFYEIFKLLNVLKINQVGRLINKLINTSKNKLQIELQTSHTYVYSFELLITALSNIKVSSG